MATAVAADRRQVSVVSWLDCKRRPWPAKRVAAATTSALLDGAAATVAVVVASARIHQRF